MRLVFIFAVLVGALETGCDGLWWGADGTPGRPPDDASSEAGLPGDGGPPISSAPDAWVASDCNGVGNLCSMNCGPAGQCQTGLNVCVPMTGPKGPPTLSAQTPYCLAATCMTYAQASCFCSGAAGSQFSVCAMGPPAVVGLCGTEGGSCSNRPCCGGLSCVKDSPTTGTCYKTCNTASDCDTGCCTDLKATGDKECAPNTACQTPCVAQGASCNDQTRCCNGTCVSSTTNPDFVGCRPSCSSNADCFSGCCRQFSNSSGGFCVDARYCNCTPAGGDCTLTQQCCSGSYCGSNGEAGTQFVCYQTCMGVADCDGGCCSTHLPGKNYGICATSCN
jgi:hypothetical protein